VPRARHGDVYELRHNSHCPTTIGLVRKSRRIRWFTRYCDKWWCEECAPKKAQAVSDRLEDVTNMAAELFFGELIDQEWLQASKAARRKKVGYVGIKRFDQTVLMISDQPMKGSNLDARPDARRPCQGDASQSSRHRRFQATRSCAVQPEAERRGDAQGRIRPGQRLATWNVRRASGGETTRGDQGSGLMTKIRVDIDAEDVAAALADIEPALKPLSRDQQHAMDQIELWFDTKEKPELRLGGLAGTGKTTIAGQVPERLGLTALRVQAWGCVC
jgi:hypothetical protein